MKNFDELTRIWGDVALPVIALAPSSGTFAAVYQNAAADALCGGADLLDIMPAECRESLTDPEAAFVPDGLPLFLPLGDRVYSVVRFLWEDLRICMLNDVTVHYRENESTVNNALMANQAKSSFLSEMSHDIRTPMGAIIGMTEIALLQDGVPTRVLECLNKIKTASGHMMSLLNKVLDMSRIESGKIILQEEDADVADLLHEILTVVKPQADAGKLNFILNLGEVCCESLQADTVRLKQVCLNLLSNAIKFTPAGGTVELGLEITRLPSSGRVLFRITVRDTGIGMSEEFIHRVFVPFEREEKSTVNKIQGTGLGMAITKNLVDLMGGTITLSSRPGQGTCFQVGIPFLPGSDHLAACRTALDGKHILLYDDDAGRGERTVSILRSLGMQPDLATSSLEAVEYINDMAFSPEEYFAFLTVEKVSDVDILLFLPQIRQRMGSAFPIILLSENDWSQIEYVYTRAGADAFIPLPLFTTRLATGLFSFTDQFRERQQEEAEHAAHNFHGKRILLAEDNEINREIAVELLGMANLRIDTVVNGQEAVERYSRTAPDHYDLILMDIQMPVMNGLDAARAIRKLDFADSRDIPIVAMTANAFVEDIRNSMAAGMNAHIAKPLDMEQMYSTLEMFLGESR